jgi:hypothetical protein
MKESRSRVLTSRGAAWSLMISKTTCAVPAGSTRTTCASRGAARPIRQHPQNPEQLGSVLDLVENGSVRIDQMPFSLF